MSIDFRSAISTSLSSSSFVHEDLKPIHVVVHAKSSSLLIVQLYSIVLICHNLSTRLSLGG